MTAPPPRPPPPPVIPAPPLYLPRSTADRDPPWVWRAARCTAAVLLLPIVAAIVALIIGIAVDIDRANDPGRTNDDGTGAGALVAFSGVILLLPLLAIGALSNALAWTRSRVALWLHALIGVVGALLALSAADDHTIAGLTAIACAAVAGVAMMSIVATRR